MHSLEVTGAGTQVRGKPARDGPGSLEWVSIAKGIGIILVVIGHFDPAESPRYWLDMRAVIYSFHMPLFFVLSGYLYVHGKYPYRVLIENKVRRLLYPFITIAVTFALIKLAAGQFVRLENPVDLHSVLAIAVDPANSYAPLLWFLQALFLIFCIYPLLRSFFNEASILLAFVLIDEVFGARYPFLGRAAANMPFFVFGILLRKNALLANTVTGRGALLAAACAFASGCALQIRGNRFAVHDFVAVFLLGLIGTLLVINASRAIAGLSPHPLRRGLEQTGFYSMTIYILHAPFEGAVRIAFLQLAHRVAVPFLVVALMAVAAGVLVPIAAERQLIRKSALARRLVLGSE